MCPEFEEVDAGSVAAEVVMLRAAAMKAVLIVEGASDERFLGKFIDEDKCDLVIARGKDRALAAIAILRARGVTGVLCLVDKDYDEFLGVSHAADDVVVTDDHDIETMVLKSPAFDDLLREMGSTRKLDELEVSPRELLLRAAHPIGVVRLYSHEKQVALKFDGLKFRFVSKKTLGVDVDKMISDVLALTGNPEIKAEDVSIYISQWEGKDHDPWQMCCGHDLTTILGVALRTVFGTNNGKASTVEEVEKRLRLAFDSASFRVSDIFSKLRSWEQRNAGFVCLRAGF